MNMRTAKKRMLELLLCLLVVLVLPSTSPYLTPSHTTQPPQYSALPQLTGLAQHLNIMQQVFATSTSVDTTTQLYIGNTGMRYTVVMAGLFWAFYYTGSTCVYRSSSDGVTWSSATSFTTSCVGGYSPGSISVWYNGTQLFYVAGSANPVAFRVGTPHSDGSITWAAAEQSIAVPGNVHHVSIVADSNGNPWIFYVYNYLSGSYYDQVYVSKSSKKDGTWTAASGFPYAVGSASMNGWKGGLVPLTGGKMLVMYSTWSGSQVMLPYTGSSWGTAVNSPSAYSAYNEYYSAIQVPGSDVVDIVYLPGGTTISFFTFTYPGTVSAATTVQASVGATSQPSLSMDTATKDLYCVWTSYPTTNHIYFKKYTFSTTTWDASPTDWLTETSPALVAESSGQLGIYATYSTSVGSDFGILYILGSGSPYTLKYANHASSISVTSNPAGSGYAYVDGSAVTTPQAYSWLIGSTHNLTAVSTVGCGAGCQYAFYQWSGTSFGTTATNPYTYTVPATGETVTAVYKKEWSIGFSYSVTGTPPGSPTAPSLTRTMTGAVQSPVALTGSPTAYWVDDGTTWTVTPNPLSPSTTSEQWTTTQSTSASATASTSVALTYYHQYSLTLSYNSPQVPTNFGVTTLGSASYPTTEADTTTSTSTQKPAVNTYCGKVTIPAAGTVTQLGWYAGASPTTSRLALFSDSSGPATLLAQTGSFTPTAGQWNWYAVTTNYYASASATDWLCVSANNVAWYSGYATGASGSGKYNSIDYTTSGFSSSPSMTSTTTYPSIGEYQVKIEGYTKGTRVQFPGATGSPVTSFGFYTSACTGSDKFIMALYSDSGGSPSQELWNSATAGTACSASSWNTVAIGSGTVDNSWNQQLTASAYYWLVWQWNSVDAGPYYVGGGGTGTGITLTQAFGTLSSTWSGGTTSTDNWNMRVTYTATVSGPPTAPTLTATQSGSGYTPTLTGTAASYWADAGASWSVTDPIPVVTGERWYTTQTVSGTVSAAFTTAYSYQHQYQVSFAVSGIGAGTGSSSIVTVNGTNYQYSQLPVSSLWFGSGDTASYNYTSSVQGSVARYGFVSLSGCSQTSQTGSFSVAASCTVTATYNTQYQLLISLNGHGQSNVTSGNYYTSGTVVNIGISGDGSSNSTFTRYVFSGVTGSGVGNYTGSARAFQVTINGGVSETVNWTTQYMININLSSHGQSNVTSGSWYASGTVVSLGISGDGSSNSSSVRYLYNGATGVGSISYTGSNRAFQVTMNAPINETIAWTTQHALTVTLNGYGSTTLSPTGGWYASGTPVTVTINGDGSNTTSIRHVITSIAGSGTNSYSSSTLGNSKFAVTMNATSITETLTWTTQYALTITLNGHGASNVTSGSWYSTGSVVKIGISGDSSNSSSTRYLYNGVTGTGAGNYTGSGRAFQVTMSAAITESISWQTQCMLTMAAGSGGGVSPSTGWQNSGENVTITATPDTNYGFTSWTGAGTGAYSGSLNPHWVIVGDALNETASFTLLSVSITITSSPTGSGYVYVDGSAVTTPQAYSWVIGSSHNITAVAVVSCGSGCQRVFAAWSDSGARSHNITATAATTYTASFQTQYQVSFADSGVGSDTGSATVLTLNGTAYTQSQMPQTGWYANSVKIVYSFGAPISGGTGIRYAWNATGGLGQASASGNLTVSAAGTVTAAYITQYLLSTAASPTAGGSINLSPSGGWYNSGASVQATPSANSNYAFSGWALDGSGAGRASSINVTMTAAHALTADFTAQLTMTVSYQTVGGGAPTAPSFNYTHGGVASQYALTTSGVPISVDANSTWLVSPNPLAGSGASERWMSSDALTGSASATTLVFHFYRQYLETLSYSITNGGTPTAPSLTANRFGSSTPQTLTGAATGYWFDAGATWSIPSVLNGTSSQRWTTLQTTSGTFSSATTSAFNYMHQYYLTVLLNPSNANATLMPTSGWQNATATVQMLVIPSLAYSFSGWAGSGSGSYSGQQNPAQLNMTAPITETAFLELRHVVNISVTSNPSGSGYVQVDGITVATPTVFSWDVGDTHNITAVSSVGVLSWVNWSDGSGRSHTLTVPNATATYTANYGAQITVTSSSVTGSGYVLADGSSVTTPHTFTWIVGSSHNLTAVATVACGAGCQYAFHSWSDLGSRAHNITTPATTTTYTASFVTQAIMTVSYQILGGGSPTAPTLSYVQNGTAKNYTLTVTPVPLTLDGATEWAVSPNPLSGSGASERWRSSQALNGTSSATTTVFTFYHQYLQTLSYLVNGGGSGYTAPAFNSTQYGGSVSQSLTTSATGYWFDAGASWAVKNPLAGSTSTERWNTSQTTGGTVSSAQTLAFAYQHQYYLTLAKNPPSHGNAGVLLSNSTIVQSSMWENSGASLTMIAIGVPGHTFSSWNSPDGSGYTGQTNPFLLSMSHPVQETAFFNSPPPISVTITSNPTGSGYLLLNGTAVTSPYTFTGGVGEVYNLTALSPVSGYQLVSWSDLGAQSHVVVLPNATSITYTATYGVPEQITVTSSPAGSGYVTVDGTGITTPHNYTWLSNSQHNVTATGTVSGGAGTQYAFQSWSDAGARSHLITVPGSTTAYTANYQTQYYLTVNAGTGGSASPTSAWKNASAQVQIHATPSGGYVFNSWTGSGAGNYTGTSNPVNVTINGPITENATFLPTTLQFAGYTWIIKTGIHGPGPNNWSAQNAYVDGQGLHLKITYVNGAWYCGEIWLNQTLGYGTYTYQISTNMANIDQNAVSGLVLYQDDDHELDVVFSYSSTNAQYGIAPYGAGQSDLFNVTGQPATVTVVWTPSSAAFRTSTPSMSNSWTGPTPSMSTNETILHMNLWLHGGNALHNGTSAEVIVSNFTYHPLAYKSVTVTSNQTGSGFASVDGTPIVTPQVFNWTVGTEHTIQALSPVSGDTGVQYAWQSWSDSGAQSHAITVSNSTSTYTAYFRTQYYLTMSAGPGGSASPSSGWHNSGTQVQLQATANANYTFQMWTGTGSGVYAGTDNPVNITMSGPISETASFTSVLQFDGYTWVVKTGVHGPGANNWSTQNVYVDSQGVHLKITYVNGTWYCGEIWLDHGLGYGTYTFQVTSNVANLDKNAVAGLFLYQDDTHELDVEFSRWSNSSNPNAQYSFPPYEPSQVNQFNVTGQPVTVTIIWMPSSALFRTNTTSMAHSWNTSIPSLSTTDALLHMNLWLHQSSLSNGTSAELVVSNFSYQPLVYKSVTVTSNQTGSGYVNVDGTPIVTPHVFNWTAGTEHTIQALSPVNVTSGARYVWSSWNDSGAQTHNVTITGSVTAYTADFAPQYRLIINTNSHGVSNVTSGSWYNSGSPVNVKISGDASNSSLTRYLYNGATGTGAGNYTGSAKTFQVTMSAAINESVAWQTQYYLTMSAGSGGGVSPSTGWQNSGANVTITATPDTNYAFSSWAGSGNGSYTGSANPANVTMNGSVAETASFSANSVTVTVTSNQTGAGFVTVDGNSITTPHDFDWTVGSQHNITALSPVAGASGVQYLFASWSDLGAQAHQITVPGSAAIYTALYTTQYYLTTSAGTGGSASPASGWYNFGSSVQIQATPTGGYLFASWAGSGSGSYTGTDNPRSITVNNPITEAASFTSLATSAQIPSATGHGTLTVSTGSGYMSGSAAVSEASLPTAGKPDLQFPYGLIRFTITGLSSGATTTLTITLPASAPANAQYWKYSSTEGWFNMTSHITSISGNTITLSLTDGGFGDQDGAANGVIVDDGGIGVPPAPAGLGNSGNGTVIVTGAAPTIVSIQLDPGTGSNASAIDVDTYYLVKVNVTDPAQLTSLQRLEVRLYQNSSSWPGNLDPERRQAFAWEYNGTWYQLGTSGWTSPDGVYFRSSESSPPNLNATVGVFTFKVKVPTVTHYTVGGGWYAAAYAVDKSSQSDERTNRFDVHLYVQLAIAPSMTWTAAAGTTNVIADGMPMNMTYESNAVVKIQVGATDPLSQYGDSFTASHLRISPTSNATDTGSQPLTGSLADWKTGLGVTASAPVDSYWFVSVPADQPGGTYTFTYTCNIAFQAYAT